MSADEHKALVRRFFEDFCNGRNLALADELMTPDHVYHDHMIPNVQGPQAMAQAVAVYHHGLEGHWHIEELAAAEGDRVVTRATRSGRNSSR